MTNEHERTLSAIPVALTGAVGHATIELAGAVGNASVFLVRSVAQLARRPFRAAMILEQVHFIGGRSVTIVMLTSAFTGLVLALHGDLH